MTVQEVLNAARGNMGPYCKACPVCDGKGCRNQIPGPGAKGSGTVAMRNYDAWQKVYLNLDTICENKPVDTSAALFGRKFRLPVFAAPIGAMKSHYGEKYGDLEYNDLLVAACREAGIAAFTGDGLNIEIMRSAGAAIRENGGMGVPTIKPWNTEAVRERMELVKDGKPFAIAMDIDAAGLPFLKNMTPPAGRKTADELREIVDMTDVPFIIKGVMTVRGALKALEAGAKGIVVSNHGGRVLDHCPSTCEVLPEIAAAVGDKMTVLVDGGIRTGHDVFKALALGANGVLIGRPVVNMVYGGGKEGVEAFVSKLQSELEDAMMMCGAHTVQEITCDMVRK
ncbi:MAG: alpha-hydroxy-acid oxidizing protein [Clostridiales bacterium]|nr:alpha-hydroxy-acid oxidizing protein [Clostridiales bacterium]